MVEESVFTRRKGQLRIGQMILALGAFGAVSLPWITAWVIVGDSPRESNVMGWRAGGALPGMLVVSSVAISLLEKFSGRRAGVVQVVFLVIALLLFIAFPFTPAVKSAGMGPGPAWGFYVHATLATMLFAVSGMLSPQGKGLGSIQLVGL